MKKKSNCFVSIYFWLGDVEEGGTRNWDDLETFNIYVQKIDKTTVFESDSSVSFIAFARQPRSYYSG